MFISLLIAAYLVIGAAHASKYAHGSIVDRPYNWHPVYSLAIWPVYALANREGSVILTAAVIFAGVYGFAG